MNQQTTEQPQGIWAELRAYAAHDVMAGAMVFLLALPLSLGIAKASGFPAAMGVLTAMVGGLFTFWFRVAPLTIKGPAAGLITVCAGAVAELGGGEQGWKVACAAVVVMGLLQIVFGKLRFGTVSDFFPHTAIHGMLSAIGLIIIAKQIPVLLGNEPKLYQGDGPLQLYMEIPQFISYARSHIAAVGLIALAMLFAWPRFKWAAKVPAPLVVLLVTVPLSLYWNFRETEQSYSLVEIGNFWGSLGMNADFSAMGSWTFWKYVIILFFVSSLESLLTVKAIDKATPDRPLANADGDLSGQGAGNMLAGLLGGLPMISEVVRSTTNVGVGARSKWSGFFHGVFLLLAMAFCIPFIEMIPNAALAAMLIFAGYRLAAPKEFFHVYEVGKEQFFVFLATIFMTLWFDLLVGVGVGMALELLLHVYHGVSWRSLFRARYQLKDEGEELRFCVRDAALFSNLLGYKKALMGLPQDRALVIDFRRASLIDHSFMSFIRYYEARALRHGRKVRISGFHRHDAFSEHPLATRKLKEVFQVRQEIQD